MNNFKSGDKVITTEHCGWYEVGEVFTLTKPYKDCGWYTLEKGEGYFVDATKIERYNQSLKDMLQNGVRVKLRNGLMYTYIDGYFANINTTKDGLSYLSEVESWTNDLHYHKYVAESEWDVMEIFAKVNIYDYFNNEIKGRSIWKREEKTPEQIELEALQQQAQDIANRIQVLQGKL